MKTTSAGSDANFPGSHPARQLWLWTLASLAAGLTCHALNLSTVVTDAGGRTNGLLTAVGGNPAKDLKLQILPPTGMTTNLLPDGVYILTAVSTNLLPLNFALPSDSPGVGMVMLEFTNTVAEVTRTNFEFRIGTEVGGSLIPATNLVAKVRQALEADPDACLTLSLRTISAPSPK